jgi:SulP family sulfate permease
MIHPPDDSVSLRPFRFSKAPSREWLRADLQAGATVAAFAVPQAMAYATLAGLPPANGLYAAIVMSIVAALWGSSPYVNTGPTNTAALLTASAIAPVAANFQGDSVELLRLVFVFSLLVGSIRASLGLLRLGWIVRFVPGHAMLGFVVAADLLIALGQLHDLLGVAASKHSNALLKAFDVVWRAGALNPFAFLVGGGTVAALFAFDRWAKRFPIALATIAIATLVAIAINVLLPTHTLKLVRDVAPVVAGLPPFRVWSFELSAIAPLLPGALAVAAIGLVEATAIGQSLAVKKRERVSFNQEFFGQGLAQIVSAFFGGFPGSGSFSRSSLIERNGGHTAAANIFFGVFTALALLIAPRALERIPLASLAGLLLFTGIKLIDVGAVRRVWQTSRADAAVLALTFAVTLLTRIEWGFFAGIVAAMALFAARARDLQLFELVPRNGRFEEHAYARDSRHDASDLVALSLQGELFFGLAHDLREQLGEIVREQRPQILVIRTRRAHAIDSSCWAAILDFASDFKAQGGEVLLTGVSQRLVNTVRDTGMNHILPEKNLVSREAAAGESFEIGLQRAIALLGPDAMLAPAWCDYVSQVKDAGSLSHVRRAATDQAAPDIMPLS